MPSKRIVDLQRMNWRRVMCRSMIQIDIGDALEKDLATGMVLATKMWRDVQIHDTDRYWGCPRKGLGNRHGFGHKDVEECAEAVQDDESCTTGQFDYNQKYNGQCKCVISDGDCTKVKGLRNYNTYSIIGFL